MIKLFFAFFTSIAFANTPLIEALNLGRIDVVEKLSQNKELLNQKDSEGLDAIFHAVSLGERGAVEILLKAGARTNGLYETKKETLLFEASRLGANDIIEILAKKDPSLLSIKNTDQETALFEAVRSNQSKTVELLVKKGLSLKDKNKDGKSPKDYASKTNTKMSAVLKKLSK